jgi:hypothetical protein
MQIDGDPFLLDSWKTIKIPAMKFLVFVLGLLSWRGSVVACDLCAIYSANSARGDSDSGPLLTLNEQFTSYGTLQQDGNVFKGFPEMQENYLASSITHLVPGYNFSPNFGLNLNIPIIYRSFTRVDLQPNDGSLEKESGTVSGLGDVSLIARWTAFKKVKMSYSIIFNVLAGVKFPTGDTDRLDQEVERERFFNEFFGTDVHAHTFGGIHQHDLTLGSGSFDGVFGTVLNLRWKRWFINQQFQYYLRTEANDYQFGDWLIVSAGPGAYVLLDENYTLSVQASAFYEAMKQDMVTGKINDQTGSTAWYLGPQLVFTMGDHFSTQAGVDLPLRINNHGLQSVPDYRVHAAFKWRF